MKKKALLIFIPNSEFCIPNFPQRRLGLRKQDIREDDRCRTIPVLKKLVNV